MAGIRPLSAMTAILDTHRQSAPAVDLAGRWRLAERDGEYDVAMRVPGDVHSALFDAGAIPDPYAGRNEYGLRWVADREWLLSRSFALPARAPLDGWVLEIDQLDTVAEIRLNGETVAGADNAFRHYRGRLDGKLREGENRIEILFRSATAAANARQAAQPFRVPWHAGNSPIPNGNMLRKPQCHFGWDWNIALAPLGLYGNARLRYAPDVLINAVLVRQAHAPGSVTVDVEVLLDAASAVVLPYSVALGEKMTGGVADLAREDRVRVSFVIDDPDLWWPAGLGSQTLHELVVSVGGVDERRRIGLRSVQLLSEPDEVGRSFRFVVNGKDVFCRGANWIPADALPGRVSREKTRDLLASAVAANMNMLRVWGGGQYEPDWFYDLCDEMGLLVWQDFMFACHLYPADDTFLGEVAEEAREQVRRLQHHACLALWCGDNELLGALNWFEESRTNRDRYLVAYDRLNRTLEKALRDTDPQANWWPSSPSPGPLSFGDAWHDDSSGDMHFWSVWHEGRDFEHYREVKPRFCSEFGFQSYPSMNVIRSFAGEEDLNIASQVMESHQKNKGGNARIAETMFRYFRFPASFADFVYLSQVQQGLAIRTAVEYWRSLKPHCMGALYWQLNDTWPVASWSSLDYGGGWKALHYMARRFFAPVAVFVIPDADGDFTVHAVNDGQGPVEVSAMLEVVAMDGTVAPLGEFGAAVPTNRAIALGSVAAGRVGAGSVLSFRWRASDGSEGADHVAPGPYKALALADPGLRIDARAEGDVVRIGLSAAKPALFVSLEAAVAGRFSDNCLSLFPHAGRTIEFTPSSGSAAEAAKSVVARDLYTATR